MLVDLLFDPFDAHWCDVQAGAVAAEAAGFDGIWLYDHLAGSVHGAARVLECWTTITAIAASVPRLTIGPLVLNVANRDPGTLAVMAATLQEVSDGRLLLGLGAGGGHDTPYASEQQALGRHVPSAVVRRDAVEDAIDRIREVWTGRAGAASGFLRPEPPPPVVVGGFGPKMAELAGRVADGINTPAGPRLPALLDVARRAAAEAGRDPERFLVTASGAATPHQRERLGALGVHRLIVYVRPPYLDEVARAHDALSR